MCEAHIHNICVLHKTSPPYAIKHHAVQYKENMELRMKHASTPEKFMASELDLDEEVRRYNELLLCTHLALRVHDTCGDNVGVSCAEGSRWHVLIYDALSQAMAITCDSTEHSASAQGGQWERCAVMRRLQAIAGSPELYPELIRLGGLPHILALLSHDNSDIAASAIQLLRELTDADAIEDSVRHCFPDLTCIQATTAHSSHPADALSQCPWKIIF